MRTETVTLYKFSELSDAAKARAVTDYRTSEDYHFAEDAMGSIKALAEHFHGRVSDWSIDWLNSSPSSMRFNMPEDMERVEIQTRLDQLGTFNPDTLKGDGDCKLTGYCADEAAIDGFRAAFMAGESDLAVLMPAGYQTWLKDTQSDAEYQFSLEGYAEHAEANAREFTEDGDRWPR